MMYSFELALASAFEVDWRPRDARRDRTLDGPDAPRLRLVRAASPAIVAVGHRRCSLPVAFSFDHVCNGRRRTPQNGSHARRFLRGVAMHDV